MTLGAGESLAVDKYHDDTVYYTTGCKRGKGFLLITATGKGTFVGRTASLVTQGKGKGHFQMVMTSIGTTLLVFVMVFTFIFWFGGFFRNIGISSPKDNNLLVYTLIFLVSRAPVLSWPIQVAELTVASE